MFYTKIMFFSDLNSLLMPIHGGISNHDIFVLY